MFLVTFFVAVCRRIQKVLQVYRDLKKVAEHCFRGNLPNVNCKISFADDNRFIYIECKKSKIAFSVKKSDLC